MNVILLSYELLRSDHQLVQAQDDAERSGDSDGEASMNMKVPKFNQRGTGRVQCMEAHRYCSFSSVSIVIVRGSP